MKLNFLIFAMALAAMGPARDGPVPDMDAETRQAAQPRSPEEVTKPAAPTRDRPELVEYAADAVTPEQFRWNARPVVVFSDTAEDPAFRKQLQALRAQPRMLADRDVVVITDADPAANSLWRQQLHPGGFSLVVLDKDGQVKLRKPFPWDVREISRAIDKFPLRRQEIGRSSLTR